MQVLDSTHSEVCHKVLERNTHMTSCYHELGSSVCPPLHQLVSVLHLFSFSTCTLTQTTEHVLCNIIIPVLLNVMVDSSDKPFWAFLFSKSRETNFEKSRLVGEGCTTVYELQ